MTLDAVVGLLACPTCQQTLTRDEGRLVCRRGHSFDLARQGHVNLLGRAAPQNADTADMVAARARFLGAGHYQPIVDALRGRVRAARRIVEVGAGTGHYLAGVLDAHPDAVGLATDISPMACRRAAKAHPRMGAVVADTWAGLPIRSGVADVLLCCFAPRNPAEFARVTAPGGLLLVVTPNEQHLAQARESLGLLGIQEDKLARLNRSMAGAFEAIWSQRIRWTMTLDTAAVTDLVQMGPNAFHEHGDAPGDMAVDADVQLSVFRRPGMGG
ncbi:MULTISPECIES: putative RNA methyltransferase [unclassified Luteococcus]|uniref:putative RNA methyltransferase n=1 Tax=unclassified Luteococcus TaxID=2639923 RepID=UPI00313AD1D7